MMSCFVSKIRVFHLGAGLLLSVPAPTSEWHHETFFPRFIHPDFFRFFPNATLMTSRNYYNINITPILIVSILMNCILCRHENNKGKYIAKALREKH